MTGQATRERYGASALMYACQQGKGVDVLHIIQTKPEATTERERTLKTALHYCAESGEGGVIAAGALLKAAPELINLKDQDGYTALHLAVIAGNLSLTKLLLSHRADINSADNEGHTAAHWATVCGEISCLEYLLLHGGEANIGDVHGGCPLHYAAQMCGPASDMPADRRLGMASLRILLDNGADPNRPDSHGRSPILWAASAGSSEAILVLVNTGANVAAADKDGLTALHCAASRGHTDCVETLISLCNAEVDVIDNNGCSALFYAVTLGHADATQCLLNHGANTNRQDPKGQLETLRVVANWGGNMWQRTVRGDYPLHDAVSSGRIALVLWLLNGRPDAVNAPNNDGKCPLHFAAIHNNIEMCKALLDAGSLVNPVMRTSRGILATPLDTALHKGHRGCAKYLQLHGGVPASKLNSESAALRGLTNRPVYLNRPSAQQERPLEISEANKEVKLAKDVKNLGTVSSSVPAGSLLTTAEIPGFIGRPRILQVFVDDDVMIRRVRHHLGSDSSIEERARRRRRKRKVKRDIKIQTSGKLISASSAELETESTEEDIKKSKAKDTTKDNSKKKSSIKTESNKNVHIVQATVHNESKNAIDDSENFLTINFEKPKLAVFEETLTMKEIRGLGMQKNSENEIDLIENEKQIEISSDILEPPSIDESEKETVISRKSYENEQSIIIDDNNENDEFKENEIIHENKQEETNDVIIQEKIVEQDDIIHKDSVEQDDIIHEERVEQDDIIHEDRVEQNDITHEEIVEQDVIIQKEKDDITHEVKQEERLEQNDITQDERVEQDDITQGERVEQDDITHEERVEQNDIKHVERVEQNDITQEERVEQDDITQKESVEQDDITQKERVEQNDITQEEKVEQNDITQEDRVEQCDITQEDRVEQNDITQEDRVEQNDITQKESVEQNDITQKERVEQDNLIGTRYNDFSDRIDKGFTIIDEQAKNIGEDFEENTESLESTVGIGVDSSLLPDSGIEPSPRHSHPIKRPRSKNKSRIPRACRRNQVGDAPLSTISVTQAVQYSVRKYHLERRIFHQLLELKRLQIRAGRASEGILVKRLVDDYKRAGLMLGLQPYDGVYSFRSFEKYLYEQLRLLQSSERRIIPRLKSTDDLERLTAALRKSRIGQEILATVPNNPVLCTYQTHRCHHATHAYTGIPCAAYITRPNHHQMPKPDAGFLPRLVKDERRSETARTLRYVDPSRPLTLELSHGDDRQIINLPTSRLDRSKRYFVTFTVRAGHSFTNENQIKHVHATSS
ncbi:hypothetical protein O3M35_003920 [Rhynocoris fuscipes]|uniref:Uncharacterized protein n=1 Tax=Rhynocoris fuscipes TaxID=488301 RepID=A0AAW1CIX9_9HEMI